MTPPGFRVSRCSPGMTGCHEWREQVKILFLGSRSAAEAKNLFPSGRLTERFFGLRPQNDNE
jgi:hypothetical protein